ncbi:MAG: ABC transporter permease [Ornithinimicrobium sp.]
MIRALLTMTASDLRQRIRDRSVIIFALIVPLALMFVFNLVFGNAMDSRLQPTTVAISAPAADPLAPTFATVLGQVDLMDITVEEMPEAEARARAEDGSVDVSLIVPDGFASAVTSGQGVDVVAVESDTAGLEGQVVLSIVASLLTQFNDGAVAATAGFELGIPPTELAQVAQDATTAGPAMTVSPGTLSAEQLSPAASTVAGQAGLFLLFTVGFGVLGLISEKEQGTYARLRSMPMSPTLIVSAKALVSFVLGIVATAVLLGAGAVFFDVSFGSVLVVGVLIAAVVTASTSLMFIVARLASTAEQAGIAQSILAISLGMAGGAFFPITATGVLGTILDLNPIAAFTRGLGISANGGAVADVSGPLLVMLGFAVVTLVITALVPDRSAQR